jgi:type IV pilus assembly protein PilY1
MPEPALPPQEIRQMLHRRIYHLILAIAIGATAGLPVQLEADDTEIYLGNVNVNTGVRPNVLFILDTSGSMSGMDGMSQDRLDRMKDALKTILDDANNINVGLMRFTDPGGPILFPVSYIDEDVSVVEAGGGSGADINVQIDSSSDDAEELVSGGSVDVLSPQLDLITATAAVGTTQVVRQVASQASNAEERLSDGDIITANQIDMNPSQANGVRFDSVNIPNGAMILDARIVFTARNSDSSSTALTFHGHLDADAPTFSTACNGCYDVSGRTRTSSFTTWNPTSWSTNNEYLTDDLSPIVQEIVNQPGWASGNAMGFIQTNGGAGQRRAYTFQGSSSRAAKLEITYATSITSDDQIIGLRFQGIGIPQGATVTSAVLEFWPAAIGSDVTNIRIYGEDSDDASSFAASVNNISSRTRTTTNVDWSNVPAWDDVNVVRQSPDVTGIVQEIVNRGGWCGDNAMAFVLELNGSGGGPRMAESFDNDPSRAPVLRVNYDETSVVPGACINQWVQRQVEVSDDDAEETISSGSVSIGGASFDMRASQVNGLRFQNLPIAQGTRILEAQLVFTARSASTGAATLRFHAEDADDSPGFSSSVDDVSARTTTTATATWTPADWDIVDEQHVSSDLTALVQEIVDRPGWSPGNSLTIVQSHDSGVERHAHTYNGNAAAAPMLRIKVNGALVTGGSGFKTVRTRLKEIIEDLDHMGHTPIVDTLYEAARYYRGDSVYWGLTRGFDRLFGNFNAPSTNDAVRRNTRVSNPASYSGGFVIRDAGCTDANLNAPECITEMIAGAAEYESPISDICQGNNIVLLTDGIANHNDSEALIKSYIPTATCMTSNSDEACARDLVNWMQTNDMSVPFSGDQTINTYTIGFNFSGDLLRDMANLGGGRFYEASTSNELANVFRAIITDILARTTSFATPSLSVNSFNRLFHRNDVYFSLFKPNARARWTGNTKKYQLCESASDGCVLGEILDANDAPAIGSDNRILDLAESFWSGVIDGNEVEVGGAGNEIPPNATRRVFTYTDVTTPPDDELLDQAVNEIRDANAAITKELLGDPLMSDADRTALIGWIRGQDVDDEDGDADLGENRYAFHDPLHSSPVAVTYGGTALAPVDKLFVGTNDGGLRMLNAANGIEEWIFYPQTVMPRQRTLRANPTGNHMYGIDGTPSIWMNDENTDGIVDPALDVDGDGTKEFVKVFVGMRRGGDNYYALDATQAEVTGPLTDPQRITDISPTLMWRIEGNSTQFPRLGQTWSRPKVTRLRFGTDVAGVSELKSVLVFAGGYDDIQDTAFTPSGLGNAIYVVDAETGARLFWISATDHGGAQGVVVPEMTYPIPSDVAMFDSDADGTTNRLYVGDTGGQVWRVDFAPDLSASAGLKAVVGKFATVSDGAEPADRRKFFYPPDIVQVTDQVFSSAGRYDMVTMVTGDRSHPLETTVQNRLYAMRDLHVAPLVDGDPLDPADDDGLADGYGVVQGKTVALAGDLFDVTTINDPSGADLTSLQAAKGFHVDLTGNGEKGLAPPIVLAGTVYFTTYLPDGVISSSSCSLAEGAGLLYAIDVLNGAAVFNWDGIGDINSLAITDRTYTLGGGIPSGAVPIFQSEGITLLVGGGGGATTIDPDLALPRARTYWTAVQP